MKKLLTMVLLAAIGASISTGCAAPFRKPPALREHRFIPNTRY